MTMAGAWCLLMVPEVALGNAPPAAQTAVEVGQPQKKRSFFSRFRKKPAAPPAQAAPRQPGAAAAQTRQQAQQGVPQQQVVQEEKKSRFSLRMPKLKMPRLDLSRVPKPKMPNIKMPKLKVPKIRMPKVKMPQMKVKMPKLRWPFRRGNDGTRQTVQNYPNGVRNPRLGGAFGVIQENKVKFYEIGPSQPFGPDEVLKSGTLVTIRSNDKSWAYVTLRDGRSGYIGLDQVRLAAKTEVPGSLLRPGPRVQQSPTLIADGSDPFLLGAEGGAYAPPALPTVAAELPQVGAPEGNPLLGRSVEDEGVLPLETPVDSPDVLFDPLLEPLDPLVPEIPGGPEPFLDDPIPTIEEELRAIQEAKAREAEAAGASGGDDVEGDGEAATEG